MARALHSTPTYAAYLDLHDEGDKYLWVRGEVFAMSGASPTHNRLCSRVFLSIGAALHHPCEVVGPDQRVRIDARDVSCYPDLMVVCGVWELAVSDPAAVCNPAVVVEVLSPSTEAWDRGGKFQALQELGSLRHYLLLSQKEPRAELFTRNDDATWTLRIVETGTLLLEAIGVVLDVDACYEGLLQQAP